MNRISTGRSDFVNELHRPASTGIILWEVPNVVESHANRGHADDVPSRYIKLYDIQQ
jgi:hypothetical protein